MCVYIIEYTTFKDGNSCLLCNAYESKVKTENHVKEWFDIVATNGSDEFYSENGEFKIIELHLC